MNMYMHVDMKEPAQSALVDICTMLPNPITPP